MSDARVLLGVLGVLLGLTALIALRRAALALLRFALRALAGGGALAALGTLSGPLGLNLGINWFNLALLGFLCAPGLGLLLLLNWLLA